MSASSVRNPSVPLAGVLAALALLASCRIEPDVPDGVENGRERYRDAVDVWELACAGTLPRSTPEHPFQHSVSRIIGGSLVSETTVFREEGGRRAKVGYNVGSGAATSVRVLSKGTWRFSVETDGAARDRTLSVMRTTPPVAGADTVDQVDQTPVAVFPCARVEHENDGED